MPSASCCIIERSAPCPRPKPSTPSLREPPSPVDCTSVCCSICRSTSTSPSSRRPACRPSSVSPIRYHGSTPSSTRRTTRIRQVAPMPTTPAPSRRSCTPWPVWPPSISGIEMATTSPSSSHRPRRIRSSGPSSSQRVSGTPCAMRPGPP